MKLLKYYILIVACLGLMTLSSCGGNEPDNPKTTKAERKSIARGNELFNDGKFEEAEAEYRKALQANPNSEVARYDLASALLGRATTAENDTLGNKFLNEAASMLQKLGKDAKLPQVKEWANYDLGNLAFNDKKYAEAIENYKESLRANPENDATRENLRLAQKMLQNQPPQDDKNQEKEDNKDQNKEDEDKQDKQDSDNNQEKDDRNQPPQQQQQPQPQGGISDDNARQILRAMENEENATRQRFNMRNQNGRPSRPIHGNPW